MRKTLHMPNKTQRKTQPKVPPSPMLSHFAENLRRARKSTGMTQEAFADACELHRTHISLLEQAKRDPKMTTIVKLADGLQTTPARLLRGVSESRTNG